MKKLLCVFVVLFGLAFSNEMDDHQDEDASGYEDEGYSGPFYELSELLEFRFCTLTVRDPIACKFADSMLSAMDGARRASSYMEKMEKAKEAGKTDEARRLKGRQLKVAKSSFDSFLKACEIWDEMSYRGKQFIINHVVHTQDGETGRIIQDEDEMLDLCEFFNEKQKDLQKAIKEYEEEIKAKK